MSVLCPLLSPGDSESRETAVYLPPAPRASTGPPPHQGQRRRNLLFPGYQTFILIHSDELLSVVKQVLLSKVTNGD